MTKSALNMGILGNSGTHQSQLRVWLPDEGRSAADFYAEMRDRDAIVGAVLLGIEGMFRGVTWSEKPADDSEAARRWADFLGECRGDMSHTWAGLIGNITGGLVSHGWAYFEKVYKLRLGPDQEDASRRSQYTDGLVGLRKVAKRPQRSLNRWEYDADGGIQGMWQNTPNGTVFIPIQKSLHFTSNEDGPEGRSMLINARQSYVYQERVTRFESIGIERDLAGMPKLEVPPELLSLEVPGEESTEEERQNYNLSMSSLRALERMAEDVRNDERAYVVVPAERVAYEVEDGEGNTSVEEVPSGYKFTLMTSGGTRAHDTDTIIKRHSQRLSAAFLASFLLLGGSEGNGTQALSTSLTDLFLKVLSGLLDSITEILNRFMVKDLMRLNGVPPELWPTLKNDGLQDKDTRALLSLLGDLAGKKVITPDASLEAFVRGLLDLPEAAPDPEPAATRSKAETPAEDAPEDGDGTQEGEEETQDAG